MLIGGVVMMKYESPELEIIEIKDVVSDDNTLSGEGTPDGF